MSDIDMTFVELPSLSVLAASLERTGCTVLGGDPFSYMEDYDWKDGDPADRDAVLSALSHALSRGTTVGFHVSWPKADASLMISPEHRLVSLSPHTGGSLEVSAFGIPRMGWLWDVLLTSLGSLGVVSMTAQSVP
ncbi:hypothetical protein ACFW1A_36730 [Kitasatospora sp. NPDC058965]|uniref:hypothetical protein n=1 Tax=Kitasatospora sp. NPDC058965 TaxID=3346682 RepID=UPI0036A2E7A1